ncbi:hypothetical protein [Neisseria weixii]|uniref:hypothetical protein n=1 Tax=Neisseria weixii TaxID=1853276 RepID=UPI0018DFD9F6|nr:hypothetical protein [Neisseria weixii]
MLTIALLLYPEVNPFHFSVPYMAFQDAAEDGLFEVKIVTPQASRYIIKSCSHLLMVVWI